MYKNKKISGFTFIKNGLTLGYPILESVLCIEPICDEVIINVGFEDKELTKDDGTYAYLTSNLTDPKYKFIKSWWDPEIRKSGLILSQQTDIALNACTGDYCQYIQGDECIHEDDIKYILEGIDQMEANPEIQGLIFNYIHLFGNVDTFKFTRNFYRREVRLIRNNIGLVSYLDAQGFRFPDKTKMKARLIEARIFHYGWARSEKVMHEKQKNFKRLYTTDNQEPEQFTYKREWGVQRFTKSHPKIMKKWIDDNRDPIDLMSLPLHVDNWRKVISLMLTDTVERFTNYRIGEFKNYKRI